MMPNIIRVTTSAPPTDKDKLGNPVFRLVTPDYNRNTGVRFFKDRITGHRTAIGHGSPKTGWRILTNIIGTPRDLVPIAGVPRNRGMRLSPYLIWTSIGKAAVSRLI